MAKQFNPRKVLTLISNRFLAEFFRRRSELQEIPWAELAEEDMQIVYDAWQALPEDKRREVQVILQDIHELSDPRGLNVLAEEIQWRCPERMAEFAAIEGRSDKAMWVYLNVPAAFNEAAMFSRADALATGRYWVKRNSLPKNSISVTAPMKASLAQALTGYYGPTQGRGQWCHVEHFQRANGNDYFFAYLDDYPDKHEVFEDGGRFRVRAERGAFDNVFVFCPNDGTLELYAHGGQKVYTPLQALFCQEVLGITVDPAQPALPAYQLDRLTAADLSLHTAPEDRIAEVRIRRLRLEVIDAPRRRVILEADPKGHRNDIYQMIERYLNAENLPMTRVRVTLATFKLTFMSDGGRPKTLTFDVSLPSSCDLKSKPDEMRVIGERCLKRWGIAL